MNPEQSDELGGAKVIAFPAAAAAPAEVVEADLPAGLSSSKLAPSLAKFWPKLPAPVTYRVRKAPRDAVRLAWFAVRGHGRWVSKGWRWATYGDLRADARTARAAGNAEVRRAAQEAIRADARARWAKLQNGLVNGVIAAGGVVVVVGVMAMANVPMVREALALLGAALPWLVMLAPLGWLVAAVWEGRELTPGAGFLLQPDRDDADSWIDERMISQALAHLGITPLDRFFKDGGQLAYTVPARLDGDGTFVQVRLPMGVTAEMVAARRNTLAANLGRASLETWPTQGDEAGVLDLWVADKGRLGNGVGDWPLLRDGVVDVFAGVPVGRSLRGAVIEAPLFECNYLIGGRPGQGKTNLGRTLALGASLDPTAELWVFVMGQSPDFAPLEPRLSRYAMGMDDSVAEAAVQALKDLLVEMERRGKVLGQQPGSPPKTSRKLANKPALGLHWLGCWIDECHELFMHPRYGKEAAEMAVRLIKRGRKYGISLVLMTQSPLADSLPREITRNVSCGVAFSVGDQVANDGLLGAGRYRAGIRATDLRMKTDRGTCVTVGLTEAPFELLGTYYVPFEDGRDEVSPVVRRAMAELGELRRTGQRKAEPAAAVDVLADVAEVLDGQARVRTQVVLARLAELNAAQYEGWTFGDLKAALAEYEIEPVKSDGRMVVRADEVTAALNEREAGA